MRKEATETINNQIANVARYHGGSFETLNAYMSDRPVKLDYDYTVSNDNPDSIKKMFKVGSHLPLIGIEFETVSDLSTTSADRQTVIVNIEKMIFQNVGLPKDFFKCEQDCTVDVECVSQTFSKAWMRNNYNRFKAMYDAMSQMTITTNDSRCGMHVNLDLSNFGKTHDVQVDNVRKLGYLINKHYDFFVVAFARNRRCTRWCPRMNDSMDYWKTSTHFPTDHSSCCINMGHLNQNRVEIRLVGGQRNYPCFRNTMEVVFKVIESVKKLSWKDMDDLTKVFAGCNHNVWSRLNEECRNANVISSEDLDKIKATKTDERFI